MNMKKFNKLISVFLSVLMVFSSIPFAVSAQEEENEQSEEMTRDEVIDYVRNEMAERNNEIEFSFSGKEITKEALLNEVLQYDKNHENMGDYLKFSIADGSDSIQLSGEEGRYVLSVSYITDSAQEAAVSEKVNEIISGFKIKNDYVKAHEIYRYLCDNVVYLDPDGFEDMDEEPQGSAYGAIIEGETVCQGFATAFYRLALASGLESRIIAGYLQTEETRIFHTWNIVLIGEKWFYVDTTTGAGLKEVFGEDERSEELFLKPLNGDFSINIEDDVYLDYRYEIKYDDIAFTSKDIQSYDICTDSVLNGVCGDSVDWALDVSSGKLMIEGDGVVSSFTAGSAPWSDYSLLIKNVYVGENVTRLGDNALAGCVNLETVNFLNPSVKTDNLSSVISGDALVHSFNKISGVSSHIITTVPEKAAICNKSGYSEHIVCPECDKSITEPVIYPSTGEHPDDNLDKLCDVCNAHLDFEASGACGSDMLWAYGDGRLYISGSGEMENFSSGKAPWYSFRSRITEVIFENDNDIKSIGSYAFYNFTAMNEIDLPSGLEAIGIRAFDNCTALNEIVLPSGLEKINAGAFANTKFKSITIPKSVTTTGSSSSTGVFSGSSLETIVFEDGTKAIPSYVCHFAKNLKNVVIPESVTQIGSHSFDSCVALTEIDLPSGLKTIGISAFDNCTALNEIVLPSGLEKINAGAFANTKFKSITIPKSVITTGSSSSTGVFSGSSLETIVFEDGTKTIPSYVCYFAKNLKNVVIPESVAQIGSHSFDNCVALTEIDLPSGLKTIGSCAFYNCTALNGIVLPSGLEKINAGAFANTKFKSITIPKSVITTGSASSTGVFSGSSLETIVFEDGMDTIPACICRNAKNLKNVVIPESVTQIGSYSFDNCVALTEINLPSGLKTIGKRAFYNCTALTEVDLPSGLKTIGIFAFYNCTALNEIILPSGLEKINAGAFANTKFKSITIPKSVTTTGSSSSTGVFSGSSLETIVFEDGTKTIPSYVCYSAKNLKNVVIPESVTQIGSYSFDNCVALTEINLPSGLKTIGSYAFDNCTALTEIDLPSGLKTIGKRAFYNCTALTEIDLPSGLKTIGISAFDNCTALNEIVLPSGLEKINAGAFANTKFKSITIPKSVTTTGSSSSTGVFSGSSLETIVFEDGTKTIPSYVCLSAKNLKNVVIPESVTQIGSYSFDNCVALTEIDLPSGLKTIGSYAFDNCTTLNEIILPSGLEKINAGAFANTKFKSITIPKSVTTTGSSSSTDVFSGSSLETIVFEDGMDTIPAYICRNAKKLKSIIIPESVTNIGGTSFKNCGALTGVYIPGGVISIGKNAFEGCPSLIVHCAPESTYIVNYFSGKATTHTNITTEHRLFSYCDGDAVNAFVFCNDCDAYITDSGLINRDIIMTGIHKEMTVAGIDPTCEENGYTDAVICSSCGAVVTESEEIPALGHNIKTSEGYAATCSTTGRGDYQYCTRCSYRTQAEVIPTLPHTLIAFPGEKATCYTSGYSESVICSECGFESVAATVIEQLDHEDKNEDGVCDFCMSSMMIPVEEKEIYDNVIEIIIYRFYGSILRVFANLFSNKPSIVQLKSSKKGEIYIAVDGGKNVKKYEFEYSLDNGNTWKALGTSSQKTLSRKNLQSGKKYTIRVRYVTADSKSGWASKSVTVK